jgi:hypothetical protein
VTPTQLASPTMQRHLLQQLTFYGAYHTNFWNQVSVTTVTHHERLTMVRGLGFRARQRTADTHSPPSAR